MVTKRKNKTLYEALLGKGRPQGVAKGEKDEGVSVKRKPSSMLPDLKLRAPKQKPIKGKGGGLGDRVLTIRCTWNMAVGGVVLLVALLVGTFGLGRFGAGSGASGQEGGRMEEGRIPTAPEASRAALVQPQARQEQALCVAFYRGRTAGKEPAERMASFLEQMGFVGVRVAFTERADGWVAAILLGQESVAELRGKLRGLPSPPFDKNYDFKEKSKQMFPIPLAVH